MTQTGRRTARLDPRELDRLRRAVARAGRIAERSRHPAAPEPDRRTLRAALETARGPDGTTGAPDRIVFDGLVETLVGTPTPDPDEAPAASPVVAPPEVETDPAPPADAPEPAPRRRPVAGLEPPAVPPTPPATSDQGEDLDATWAALPSVTLSPRHLGKHLVITATRDDPAHGAFDVLRTRLLTEMRARGWRRLGITSPTKGCGKTFTAANLALTLARLDGVRTLLLDLDLRQPALARVLGQKPRGAMGDFLRDGDMGLLVRVEGDRLRLGRLAVGLSSRPEPYPAELLGEARTAQALAGAEALLDPHVTIVDLPPVLAQDDVLAIRPHLDALLLVAGGGLTTPRELREAARRIGRDTPILGVVLNKAEGEEVSDYAYAYR